MQMTKEQLDKFIKDSTDKALTPYLKVKRPDDQDTDKKTPTGLSFQDKSGVIHKACGSGEKLYTGGEDFSVGKIIRAKIVGNYEGLNDVEIKAAGEGTGALGGWLVPETVSAKILDMARNFACVAKAGAWVLPMTAPEMRLVKVTSDPTAYWKAEHAAITESDWEIEPLNLKAMKCGVLVRASIELLEDAQNSGSALEMAMGAAIGLELDQVALFGTGVNEPLGLDNAAGINVISMGANGAAPTNFDELSNSLREIAEQNGIGSAMIMGPRSYFQYDLLKAATTNNRLEKPLSVQDIYDKGKIYHTNQVGITDTQGTATDASKVFTGDYKQLVFGILKGLRFEFTKTGGTGTFAQYEALIRAIVRMDIGILRDNHFTKLEGLIP